MRAHLDDDAQFLRVRPPHAAARSLQPHRPGRTDTATHSSTRTELRQSRPIHQTVDRNADDNIAATKLDISTQGPGRRNATVRLVG
jgi:hypothetical protein